MTIHEHAPPSLRGDIMGLAEKIFHEGEIKGEARGELKGILKVAQNLLKEGTDPAFVARNTGLHPNEIKQLQEKLGKNNI